LFRPTPRAAARSQHFVHTGRGAFSRHFSPLVEAATAPQKKSEKTVNFKALLGFILSCTTPIFHATSHDRDSCIFPVRIETPWPNQRVKKPRRRHPTMGRNRSRS